MIKLSDPYVPFDEASKYETPGRLRDSAIQSTLIGSGEVIYDTPYAKWLYYNPQFNFQGAPLRGAFWVDRAMQDGGMEKLQEEISKYLKKRQ